MKLVKVWSAKTGMEARLSSRKTYFMCSLFFYSFIHLYKEF